MTAALLDLPDTLRAWGLDVVEVTGWQDRRRPGLFNPIGVLIHHTAAPGPKDAPSLQVCIESAVSPSVSSLSQVRIFEQPAASSQSRLERIDIRQIAALPVAQTSDNEGPTRRRPVRQGAQGEHADCQQRRQPSLLSRIPQWLISAMWTFRCRLQTFVSAGSALRHVSLRPRE